MKYTITRLATLVYFAWAANSLVAAEFRGLGDFPGGESISLAAGVSGNGGYVVGGSYSELGSEPFIWDKEHGIQRLDNILTVITLGAAYDVSGDGSVVVGLADFGHAVPFRWENAGFHFLNVETPGVANAVTYDGRVVVGTENYSPGGGPAPVTGTAFRWTEAEGVLRLADLTGGPECARAHDVSADGRIIVGKGDCDASFQVEDLGLAVRWIDGGPAEPLGSLVEAGQSAATAISTDGRTIVGGGGSKVGWEPFVWREGEGMIGLGRLNDAAYGEALDVTGNGRIVVGQSGDRAFLWTAAHGMRDLKEYLSSDLYKLDLTGWTLTKATAISPDGFYIVGEGINPAGDVESWRADLFHIPHGGIIDIVDLNNVRNNFGGTGPGDMPPYDGAVDIYDLNFVRNNFRPNAEASSVPEPAGLWLALFCGALAMFNRRFLR